VQGIAPALGLRAGYDGVFIPSQTASEQELLTMWFTSRLRDKTHRHSGRTHRPSLELLEDRTVPSTFLVTNVADTADDTNVGSLRWAIQQANGSPGLDTIAFQIPGSGVHTIQPLSALPTITDSVVIDGTSQPGYSGTPLIELDGQSAGANANGLVLAASNCTVQGLVINRFSRFGIDLLKSSNVVQGNYIGVDVTGNTLRANGNGVAGNGGIGVVVQAAGNIIGGTAAGGGNVIGDGISLDGADSTLIQGNTIGLGADGTTPLGNTRFGISMGRSHNVVIGGDTPAARNVISGNLEFGIFADGGVNGLVVQSNYIGTDRTGTVARGNTYVGIFVNSPDVLIGGLTATPGTGPGNVISANGGGPFSGAGIAYSGGPGTGDVVEGNIVGLDAGGTTALNNFQNIGVWVESPNVTVGGSAAGAGNVISGNGDGVLLATAAATGDVVQGNYIGTDVSGTHAAANLYGVVIDAGASGNTIGDATAGAGNVIAFNSLVGVAVFHGPSTGNSIRGNSIHDNGGLGIDLSGTFPNPDGVTPNDSAGHVGPNNYQNFPVLTGVTLSGGLTQVSGTLDSTPNTTFTIDFYANTLPDPSGYGEGQTWLGFTTVTTDPSGHASFTATVAAAPAGQQFLSATATDQDHNTSEFSQDTIIAPSSLSGMVFEDFNDDGQVDFGEAGIPGVTVTLTGTDDLGRAVSRSQQTGADGSYFFGTLVPGSYTLTETQPAGYAQGIDSVGTAGGSLVATDQFFVQLGQGIDGINYNYGERPPAGAAVTDAAGTMFRLNPTTGDVYEKTADAGARWTYAGASSIKSLVRDATGNVFDLSYGGVVYQHVLSTTTAWNYAGAASISSLVSDATGNVFDLSYGGVVYQHVPGSNSTGWNYAGAANISSLVSDATGNVFDLSYGGVVYRHIPGGNSTGWNYAGAANISSLVSDATGNVFDLSYGGVVYHHTLGSSTAWIYAGAANISSLVSDATGNVFDLSNSGVVYHHTLGSSTAWIYAGAAGIKSLVRDATGNVFDLSNSGVVYHHTLGSSTAWIYAGVANISSLVSDATGNLFAKNASTGVVYKHVLGTDSRWV
jgi:hypothetical protein